MGENGLHEYIFTFGFGHAYPNCYCVIKAESAGEARAEMFRRFGGKWAFQYDSREEAGVDRWNLKELKVEGGNQ